MAKNLDDIKLMLSKLMAKEESARKLGHLHEAEAFASKIQQLLLAYELSMDDIQRNQAESTVVADEYFDTGKLTNRHESNWVAYLYAALAKPNFCKVIFNRENQYGIFIVGTEMNREFLHYTAAQLIVKLRELSRKSFSEYEGPDKRNTYIRAFLKGATEGIKLRLWADRQQDIQKNDNVAALVVQKDRALNHYIDQKFGRLGTAKKRMGSSNDGFRQGVDAGKGVSINKGISRGAGGTKLLG